MTDTLSLAVLDFVGIEYGESAHDSLLGAIGIAQAVERAGYRRYWVSEHHNMKSLACSAPEILTAAIAARTRSIRVGAAGDHAAEPLRVQGRRDLPDTDGAEPGPDRTSGWAARPAPTR